METLPNELLTKVLEFSTLPERLQVVRCNSQLLHRVTRECRGLWIKIDFKHYISHHHLTDEMLAALLERVNARNVTEELSLALCERIVGHGLEPLRHSQVLKSIDLRTQGLDGTGALNESLVMAILETMFPYELLEVKLLRAVFDDLDRTLFERQDIFYNSLCDAKYQQALQQQIKCHACENFVAEEGNGMYQWTCCSKCRNHFCRESTCPITVKECCECETISCEPCNLMKTCINCQGSYCDECTDVFGPCLVCKGMFCEHCRRPNHCVACDGMVCQQCTNSEETRMEDCHLCGGRYCGSDQCGKVVRCQCCNSWLCKDCSSHRNCSRCGLLCCEQCIEHCAKCDKYHCEDCASSELCDDCELLYCEACCKTSSRTGIPFYARCSHCERSRCSNCMTSQSCNGCKRTICLSCWTSKQSEESGESQCDECEPSDPSSTHCRDSDEERPPKILKLS